MSKLLCANFARLWKFKLFWVCSVLAFVYAVIRNIEIPEDTSWMYNTGFLIIRGGSVLMVFVSVFAALYLGTDYSCGTIRNKLSVGYSRAKIYLSNLIAVTSGTMLISAAYTLPPVFKAIVWGKDLGMPTNKFLLGISILVCAMIAVSAILTLLGMIIMERAVAAVVIIVMTLGFIFGSAVLLETLNRLEMIWDVDKAINVAVLDILPYGQVMRLEADQLSNPEMYPLYSFNVLAVTTAAGMIIFRKKDLK